MKSREGCPGGEGWLIAAVLGLALALSLFSYLYGLPRAETVFPVHDVPYEEIRLAAMADINSADAEKLACLPGIGEELAARIIAYRQEKGGFAAVEEILNVPGIGEGKFAAIREMIYIG